MTNWTAHKICGETGSYLLECVYLHSIEKQFILICVTNIGLVLFSVFRGVDRRYFDLRFAHSVTQAQHGQIKKCLSELSPSLQMQVAERKT